MPRPEVAQDLRNRIASVKATQKITKAMQMVAAAKLRRAQVAAEAARPYATRMERVLANLARAVSGSTAPPLLAGTGHDADASARRLHRRARAVRRLQLLDRAARPRAGQRAARRRQDGEDHLRRQEGLRHPAPPIRASRSSRSSISAAFSRSASPMPTASRRRCSRCFENGEFDVATLFYRASAR